VDIIEANNTNKAFRPEKLQQMEEGTTKEKAGIKRDKQSNNQTIKQLNN
jgi:hypothetical protein